MVEFILNDGGVMMVVHGDRYMVLNTIHEMWVITRLKGSIGEQTTRIRHVKWVPFFTSISDIRLSTTW